jgi:hypothetical protein
MWKAALAGAVALATIGSSLPLAGSAAIAGQLWRPAGDSVLVIDRAQIARLKTRLKLTPAQEPLWPAVEQAFHEIGQQQVAQASGSHGAAISLNAVALQRLFTAAYPLLRTLDDEQKRTAGAFARSVGLETIAAAF